MNYYGLRQVADTYYNGCGTESSIVAESYCYGGLFGTVF